MRGKWSLNMIPVNRGIIWSLTFTPYPIPSRNGTPRQIVSGHYDIDWEVATPQDVSGILSAVAERLASTE